MIDLAFDDVTVTREKRKVEDLPEKAKVRADVSDQITDIRLAMVVGQFPNEGRISVILPGKRMDGPYNIPVENVLELVALPDDQRAFE